MSSNIRIIYNNLWRKGTFENHTSEHPQFPVEDTQADTPSQFWRSRYGNNSGGGLFSANASTVKINFNEGGGNLTATIASALYNGHTLATAVGTALNDAGALDYVVSYNDSTALFTIGANANFTLQWANGANAANSAANMLGYNNAQDDTGNNSFTGDYRRIHTYEYLYINAGSAQLVNFVGILNHTISANATVSFRSGNNANFAGENSDSMGTLNAGNHFQFLAANRIAQYFRILILDADNPNSYIQMGPIILGKYWQPNYTFAKDYTKGKVDDSLIEESHALVEYGQIRPRRRTWSLPFPMGLTQADADEIVTFFDTVGLVHGFVVCFDYAYPNTNSYFVKNSELTDPTYLHYNNWSWQLALREKL